MTDTQLDLLAGPAVTPPAAGPAAPPPIRGSARRTDPDTSHAAAADVTPRAATQAARVLWALVQIEKHGGHGATAHEVVLRLAYTNGGAPQQNVVARRLTDLAERGLVEDSGDRRLGGYGSALIVWTATAAGREHAEVAA